MAKPMPLIVLIIFLRIRSICWSITFCNVSSQSSLYKPQSFLLISVTKKNKMYIPTNWHTSAPSKLPMVTSKQFSVCFFFHASLLLNSKDLRQCFINLVLSLNTSWCCFANSKNLIMNGFCDGWVKLSNTEFNKGIVLFIFDVPKPFYNTRGIFPMVNV